MTPVPKILYLYFIGFWLAEIYTDPLAPVMSVAGVLSAPVTGGYFAKKVYQKSGEENIPYYTWKPQ